MTNPVANILENILLDTQTILERLANVHCELESGRKQAEFKHEQMRSTRKTRSPNVLLSYERTKAGTARIQEENEVLAALNLMEQGQAKLRAILDARDKYIPLFATAGKENVED